MLQTVVCSLHVDWKPFTHEVKLPLNHSSVKQQGSCDLLLSSDLQMLMCIFACAEQMP